MIRQRVRERCGRLAGSTLARFVAVGVLNSAFSYLLYAALVLLELDYRLALTISTVAGIAWNFQTTGRLVFGNRRQALIFKFALGYGLIYLLNLGLLIVLARAGVGALAGQAAALPVTVVCAFALNRWWIFRDAVGNGPAVPADGPPAGR